MLSITKQTINSQRNEIATFAMKEFGATYISVMNGKNKYLDRANFNFAHLRFTKILEQTSVGTFTTLERNQFVDTYVYVTTSTTTNKDSHDFDCSDTCFNIREEILFGKCNKDYIYLVDCGNGYFMYCTAAWAKTHITTIQKFEGRDVVTVRLPNKYYKKERFFNDEPTFDATYIQNVTYSKYRARNGLIKVEGYKDGKLKVVSYYVSTGELKDDFEAHGINVTNDYIRKLANNSGSIKRENLEYKLSRVVEVTDCSSSLDSSFTSAPKESGLPLRYSTYESNNLNNGNKCNNVMVNQTASLTVKDSFNSENYIILDSFDD